MSKIGLGGWSELSPGGEEGGRSSKRSLVNTGGEAVRRVGAALLSITGRTSDSESDVLLVGLILGLVGVELGSMELDNSKGSSPGLGGGIGAVRSISGISNLTTTGGGMGFLFLVEVVVVVVPLRFEDLLTLIVAVIGVTKTSFGGVNISVGGS